MKLYLADGIYEPSAVAGEPNFDTMLCFCNPFAVAHQVLIHGYDNNSNELPNSPISYTLQPGAGFDTSLIPGNTVAVPFGPLDGRIVIEFPDGVELPAIACISGGGANAPLPTTPINWNNWSPNLPIESPAGVARYPRMGSGKQFVFPYSIQFTNPTMHFGPTTYVSSFKLTNLPGNGPTQLQATFTANDSYPKAQFTTTISLAAGQTLEQLLTQLFPELLTINGNGSVEGWINLQVLPNEFGVIEPANLLGILLVSSADFGLSPVQMGFSFSPFIVA